MCVCVCLEPQGYYPRPAGIREEEATSVAEMNTTFDKTNAYCYHSFFVTAQMCHAIWQVSKNVFADARTSWTSLPFRMCSCHGSCLCMCGCMSLLVHCKTSL